MSYKQCYIMMSDLKTPVKQYCEENGYNYTSVIRMIKKYNCTPEEALENRKGGKVIMYYYKGQPICYMKNYRNILKRILHKHYTIKYAVEKETTKRLMYKGIPLKQLLPNKTDYDRVRARIRVLGWDIEKAMTEPKIKDFYKLSSYYKRLKGIK